MFNTDIRSQALELALRHGQANTTQELIEEASAIAEYISNKADCEPKKSCAYPSVGDVIGGGFCAGRHPAIEGAVLIVAGREGEVTGKSWPDAKEHCHAYDGGGHSDWKAQSRAEALLAWESLGSPVTSVRDFAKGGKHAFAEEYYWTGQEYEFVSGYAWHQYFGNGHSSGWSKTSALRGRPVRIHQI